MMVRTVVAIVAISSIVSAVAASEGPLQGDTYALIVSGIGKDSQDLAARDRVMNGLQAYLREKVSVKANRLVLLTPDPNSPGISTAERIGVAIDALASAAKPMDRFVLYYIGQANAVGNELRMNLPDRDATQEDLAGWLHAVKAERQLVVLDCPCAAMAAKALARPGRVIVFGSTEKQAYAPRFGMHFVPALSRPDSDTNHDGSVSVLEAFTTAAREIERWYQQRQLLPTETPCLEDDGDGRPGERPWRYELDGGDGRLAARFFLATGW